nr:hypothetical protein REQ54_04314 [Rhizobium sp. Q54]
MDPKWWKKPLRCRIDRCGQSRMVESTTEAALILLNQWPASSSEKHMKAKQTCIEVLEGKGSPKKARRAFIKAAKEANICLID